MKLHFEPNLDYQHAAIEAVADLFRGQEICHTEFTVTGNIGQQPSLAFVQNDLGIGNRLQLLDDELLANLRLLSVSNKKGSITAKVELDVQHGVCVNREEVTVQDGDDLQQATFGRAIYADCRIGEIRCAKGQELVEVRVPGGEEWLNLGQAIGDVDEDALKRQMTRRSIVKILTDSGRLNDFKRNPQQCIELTAETINRTKRMVLVDGIRYQRLGDDQFYAQELFEQEELTGYLKNMLESTKSVYEQVIYDSTGTEKSFAEELEKNEAVKVYAKLPGWFKVPTPLGTYNPDWTVLIVEDGQERLYFVVETKSSLFTDDLRDKESSKIKCGEAHFMALAVGEKPAKFVKARNLDDVMAEC